MKSLMFFIQEFFDVLHFLNDQKLIMLFLLPFCLAPAERAAPGQTCIHDNVKEFPGKRALGSQRPGASQTVLIVLIGAGLCSLDYRAL